MTTTTLESLPDPTLQTLIHALDGHDGPAVDIVLTLAGGTTMTGTLVDHATFYGEAADQLAGTSAEAPLRNLAAPASKPASPQDVHHAYLASASERRAGGASESRSYGVLSVRLAAVNAWNLRRGA